MWCVLSAHAYDVLCVVRPDPGGGIQISSKIRHQAFVAIDKPKQAFVAVDTTEYTDTNDTTDTIDITDTYDITDTHDTIDPTCSKSNPVKLLQYTVDSARLYQGPWWGISTTSLTPTPPIYRHHTTPLTLVGYNHYLLPPSRPPDRCRTGYPTPGATGGSAQPSRCM